MRQRKALPISFREQTLFDRVMRDHIRRLCAGLPCRPEPRVLFDNALAGRSAPWSALVVMLAAAVRAGQSHEHVRALGDAFHQIADTLSPPEDGDDPRRALVLEAIADADADRAQAEALADPLNTDALEHAAELTRRHAAAAVRTAHRLTFHAAQRRQRRAVAC